MSSIKLRLRLSNAHNPEYMCYNQTGDISTLEGTPLKLVDKFTYLGSSVESTEKDIETRLTKAWTAINRLSTIWKSDLTVQMKRRSSHTRQTVKSILVLWMHYVDANKTAREETMLWQLHKVKLRAILRDKDPGSGIPLDTNCTATCPLSRNLFKLREPDMLDIALDYGRRFTFPKSICPKVNWSLNSLRFCGAAF